MRVTRRGALKAGVGAAAAWVLGSQVFKHQAEPTPVPGPTPTPAIAEPAPGVTPPPSATPTPTRAPAPVLPVPAVLPIHAAFHYMWYRRRGAPEDHWSYGHVFNPTLGEYDSASTEVMAQHARWAQYAHLNAFIGSWWGPNDNFRTDANVQAYLAFLESPQNPYPNLRLAAYYELESVGDPSPAEIKSHLDYLESRLFSHRSYLQINGAPVLFVYAGSGSPQVVDRWIQAKALYRKRLYVSMQVYGGWQDYPNKAPIDSWHQYDPVQHVNLAAAPYSGSASPGFWDPTKGPARLNRNLEGYTEAVQRLANLKLDWRLITTFNEHGEGTVIEPCREFPASPDGAANLAYLAPSRQFFPPV